MWHIYTPLLTHSFTYSMEQSPWEAKSLSVSQKIPCILWKRSLPSHNSLPLVRVLRQMYLVHAKPFYYLKTYFNITLPSTSRSSKWSPSIRLPTKSLYAPHTCHLPHPSHSSWFYHLSQIWRGVNVIKFLTTQFAPVPYYLTPFRPKYFPTCPFLKTFSTYVLPSV